jgi:hypothetical protein
MTKIPKSIKGNSWFTFGKAFEQGCNQNANTTLTIALCDTIILVLPLT